MVHKNDTNIKKSRKRRILPFYALIFIFCICTPIACASTYITMTNSTPDTINATVILSAVNNTSVTGNIPADNGLTVTTGQSDGNNANTPAQPITPLLPHGTVTPLVQHNPIETVAPSKITVSPTPTADPLQTPVVVTTILPVLPDKIPMAIQVQGYEVTGSGTTTKIVYGETVYGNISSIGENQTYNFTASAMDVIIVRTRTNWTNGPHVRVYQPNNTIIAEDSGYIWPNDCYFNELQFTAPESGNYIITIEDHANDQTGTYSLSVQKLNPPANVVSITYGQTLNSSISSLGQMNTYNFTASAGDVVIVRTRTNWTNGPHVRVYQPNNTIIAEDSGYIWPNDCYFNELQFTAPESGNYIITIEDHANDQTGTYSLSVQKLNPPANVVSITYGQTLNSSISSLGQMNTYNFTASAGHVVIVRTRTNWTNGPHVRVYQPNNTIIAEDSGYIWPNDCYFNELQFTAPESGNYIITIEDHANDQTGTYSLSVQKLNPPANVVSITYGQTLNSSISSLGQMNTYNFTASAGDVVIVRTRTNWTNGPHVRVYQPNNTIIAEDSGYIWPNDCYFNELQFIAPESGNYIITIEDHANDQTGTYSLSVQKLNPPANVVSITYGQTLHSSISSLGQMNTYNFTATGGDAVSIRTRTNWTNGPHVRVYQPNNTIIAEDSGYIWPNDCYFNELQFIAPESGNYIITIEDHANDKTGTYTLSLFTPDYPIADFIVSTTSGIAPLTVQFTDTSTGPPRTWNWNFGDGSAWVNITDSAQRNVTHTYTNAGTFNATLIVDNVLGQASKNQIITVTPVAPVADFNANVTSGFAPLTVQFYDRSSGSPTAWNWSFGDNNFSTVKNPVNMYTIAGNFTVSLTVSNSNSTDQKVLANYIKVTNLTYAYGLVLNNTTILNNTVTGKSVSAALDPLPAGTTIQTWQTNFTESNTTGWFFFIDDNPGANWEHPCRYVHVDENDNTSVTHAFSPPTNVNISHIDGENPDPGGGANSVTSAVPNPGGGSGTLNLQLACNAPDCRNNYALLISGGFNSTQNHIRYWNDVSFMYQTLNQTYGYPADHIIVLMSDGTNPSPDRHNATTPSGTILADNSPVNLDNLYGSNDVTGDAKKMTVLTSLSTLNGKLTTADSLFIFTTGHGGWDGIPSSNNSILYLWNQESISDSEFVAALPSQPGNITLIMEQCYSGGFVDDFIDKYAGTQGRIIATAANGSEPSWGNGFSNAWTSGVAMIDDKRLPNYKADVNHDDKISMWEAYNYSLFYDPAADIVLPNHEHPQYNAKNPFSTWYNPVFELLSDWT